MVLDMVTLASVSSGHLHVLNIKAVRLLLVCSMRFYCELLRVIGLSAATTALLGFTKPWK